MSEREAWIVEHGEYSTYTVLMVCDSEATARAVVDLLNTEEPDYRYRYATRPFVESPEAMSRVVIYRRRWTQRTGREHEWTFTLGRWELSAVPTDYAEWRREMWKGQEGWVLEVSGDDPEAVESQYQRLRATPPEEEA